MIFHDEEKFKHQNKEDSFLFSMQVLELEKWKQNSAYFLFLVEAWENELSFRRCRSFITLLGTDILSSSIM
jgi:hypothetical protein